MTEPADTPRRPAKRKRPHPAAAGRVLVAGAATAGTLAMVGLMARPVDQPADAAPAASAVTPVSATGVTDTATAGPTRIVVVRRHHPAPSSGSVVRTSPVLSPTASASAPPVQPAPRPAPVRTKSSGS